jgi:iron-sulfur cluster assembly accessory protein
MITISDSAAEALSHMLLKTDQVPGASAVKGLRLSIERGGCAGLQYAMRIAEAASDDETFAHPSGVNFFISADSVNFLRGSHVDYSDSLSDAGFKIINPNAVRSCGCGTSFEPAEVPQQALPEGQPCV